jgi:uncharacterized protein (DUF488 family)
LRRALYTIGYTGFSVQDFVSKLSDAGIECLIDTRELPISRKKGFAKTALRQHLEEAGITYHHFRLLGSPRIHRHEVRETGDYAQFFAAVRQHIASPDATQQLQEAILLARSSTSCLMCCCPDWTLCHRSCLVESIAKTHAFDFRHLQKTVSQPERRRKAA